jgi:hypothetical protein
MYQQIIREELAHIGHVGLNPRHIEAFMRLEHPTLDGLASWQFRDEVKIAAECVIAGGEANAESCALSFGL